MSKFNTSQVKNIIREQVGFERQFINPISVQCNSWGAMTEIYFEVKGIYYTIRPVGESVEISFAEPMEAEPTEATEETANA